MGFKLPGKSIHAGTTAHSSALKMAQQEQDAAARLRAQQFGQAQGVDNNMDPYAGQGSPNQTAEAGSSPNKWILPALRVGGAAITRFAPRIMPFVRGGARKAGPKVIDVVGKTVSKSKSLLSKTKDFAKGMFSWPSMVAGTVSYYMGKGSGKKSEQKRLSKLAQNMNDGGTTTPKSQDGNKSKGSGGQWTNAVNKNKSTGGGVTLSEYVKRRNSNAKGSAKYNAAQNKINEAYGVSKRHGGGSSQSQSQSQSSSSSTNGNFEGGQVSYKKRLFGGQTKVTRSNGNVKKEKYRKGKLKKTITKVDGVKTTVKH